MISRKTIRRVINNYNRYRMPLVEASLIGTKRNRIILRFSGDFCATCGFYDYFDDLKFQLQTETGHPVKIQEIIDKGDGNYTAIFSVTPLVGFN
jgi:hypothetical protein